MLFGKRPVRQQVIVVKLIPLHHSLQCSPGKTAINNTGIDLNDDLVFTILCMEVWRSMIIVSM
jgi:hypothetical protein